MTLGFLLRDGQVCLIYKKRGFTAGRHNGFGGKVGDKSEFKDETVEESFIREAMEELEISITGFNRSGEIVCKFPHQPEINAVVHVFVCNDGDWVGEPQETEEVRPDWFKIDEIPYDEMWDDEKYWLPKVLDGQNIKAKFEFDKEGKVTKQDFKTPERK